MDLELVFVGWKFSSAGRPKPVSGIGNSRAQGERRPRTMSFHKATGSLLEALHLHVAEEWVWSFGEDDQCVSIGPDWSIPRGAPHFSGHQLSEHHVVL